MPTKRITRTLAAVLGATVAAIAAIIALPSLPALSVDALPAPTSTTAATTSPLTGDAALALEQLEQLVVAGGVSQDTYQRDMFGQRWADIDRNGCDQRNDTLARDLIDVTTKPGTRDCVVLAGTLHDPYTGQTITFQRGQGTSELVQIDHVVPLAWAWRHGASTWTEDQREHFANDPLNLQAADGSANQSKSDKGPADWMPPNTAYRCTYTERFVEILSTYQLTVDPADYTALQAQLTSCTA